MAEIASTTNCSTQYIIYKENVTAQMYRDHMTVVHTNDTAKCIA